jgi:uncharacterized protein YkwD
MKLALAVWIAATSVTACAVSRPVTVGTSGGTVQTSAGTSGVSADVDYSRLEREIFTELTVARTNPSAYAAHLSELLQYFSGNVLRRPGSAGAVRTVEGPTAVREAIGALRAQAPVPALTLSAALSRAARDLVVDQGRTGNVGHTASDGGNPGVRISRYGTWGVSYSENVGYGSFRSGRDVVVDLIVDDGVSNRGHRKNIFDASARIVGIACGPHPKYGSACVIDQVGSYAPK